VCPANQAPDPVNLISVWYYDNNYLLKYFLFKNNVFLYLFLNNLKIQKNILEKKSFFLKERRKRLFIYATNPYPKSQHGVSAIAVCGQ
jgi:hypothetical protein